MEKIFLAEDDQTTVGLLKILLKLEGYEVVPIDLATGDIIDTLYEEIPRILLLDVNLPDQNGIDVIRQMRKDNRFKDTRVIMVSGMSLEDECLASGADDFLLKPYMPDELIAILRKYTKSGNV